MLPLKVQPIEADNQRLTDDIEKRSGISKEQLVEAHEKDGRRHISILHQSTGWDARLIALLAKASKLSKETGIGQDALYALSRVGLPTDKELLAKLNISTIEKAFEKAKKARIVSPDFSIESAREAFQKFSRSILRDQKAPDTLSSLSEILDKSGLDKENREKFEDLYFSHRGSGSELWKKERKRVFLMRKFKVCVSKASQLFDF